MTYRPRNFCTLAFVAILATHPGCAGDSTSGGGEGSSRNSAGVDRIPSQAGIVNEGRGPVEYLADADGTAYVQDVQREVTIVSHRIRRGERLVVLPDADRVLLDEKPIYQADLKRGNAHRIYLLPDVRLDRRPSSRPRDDALPAGAESLDEGAGRPLAGWVQRDGRMYVYDVGAGRVATSVKVRAGQRLVFSPADDLITADGKTVSTKHFDPKSTYRLYLGDAR